MTVWRHRGRANVAFFDGHVEALRKDEITNDKLWDVLR